MRISDWSSDVCSSDLGYAWTAAWVAGIATIVPWLGWLVVLAGGIYSIYMLYLVLPHTMKCPPEKAAGYTVVTAIIAVVLSWVMALLIAATTGQTRRASCREGLCQYVYIPVASVSIKKIHNNTECTPYTSHRNINPTHLIQIS